MKILIKKHTPVRHPMSIYRVALGTYTTYTHDEPTDLDIKRVPNVPVKLFQTVSKVPKYDWTEWHEDMNKQVKPSLWQRIKRYYKEGLTE